MIILNEKEKEQDLCDSRFDPVLLESAKRNGAWVRDNILRRIVPDIRSTLCAQNGLHLSSGYSSGHWAMYFAHRISLFQYTPTTVQVSQIRTCPKLGIL